MTSLFYPTLSPQHEHSGHLTPPRPRTPVMRVSVLFACLALPVFSAAQVFHLFSAPHCFTHFRFTSPVFASIHFSNHEMLHPNRTSSNSSQTTITAAPSSASQSGSVSGTGSATGSISGSANITASSAGNATTTANVTSILPTAPSTVAGANGGGPNGGAPSPGTSASGGIYGPPDGYIAGAEAIRNAGMLGFVGFAVGGALVLV
ncbi:hypothetical protein J3R83DRAFT_6599 [Lanmaoa asiatica]|nr:hypothetical protein J3R83DRAFT_6599 [Lanmaoa asiatica]